MTSFLALFTVLIGIFSNLVSTSHTRDELQEQEINGTKRIRRNSVGVENSLINGIQSIRLSEPIIPEFVANNPVLMFCYCRIPQLTERELDGMFDEAISNENFELIQVFSLHGKLETLIDSDHIEALCRGHSEVSTEILDYLLDKFNLADEIIQENLPKWLNFCVPFGFEKFKLFWNAFNGEKMSVVSLASVLTKISSYETRAFYDFVLEKIIFDTQKLDIIMKWTVTSATMCGNYKVVTFLFENGLSLSTLDLEQKEKIIIMATNTNNTFLVSFLLRDKDVIRSVRVMPKSPFITAVQRDYPEILDAYIKAIPNIQLSGLAMLAFTHKKHRIMEYFMSKSVLNDEILFRMALIAIQLRSLDAMKYLNNFGIPFQATNSDGWNLLTIAVEQDATEIVEFLIKTCGMNPNAINRKFDISNTMTTFRAIYFAKSPNMVRILVQNGANVNAKFERFTHHRVIIKSTTALHKAAFDLNMIMFGALLENGADIKIADAVGLTNEAIYYRHFFNFPENF